MGLFAPIWKTSQYNKKDKAIRAVKKISDPEILKEIALTAPMMDVQETAARQISDPEILKELALTAAYYVKRIALEGISDQRMLAEIIFKQNDASREAVEKITDQLILKQIALSDVLHAEEAVRRITDQKILAEVAKAARNSGARVAAVGYLKDADILTELMADKEWYIREGAILSVDKTKLTPEQHEKYLNAIIEEKANFQVYLYPFKEKSDLERIYANAAREDLREKALVSLANNGYVPAGELKGFYKTAFGRHWREACNRIASQIENRCSDDPVLLLSFVKDAEVGPELGSRCLKFLFHEKFQSFDRVDDLRDEGVEVFLANIPQYETMVDEYGMKEEWCDRKHCLYRLQVAIPEPLHERYGLRVTRHEYEAEDGFGRYTTETTKIIYNGETYFV